MAFFALTCAYNEDFFLERWVGHYGRQLGYENLYILDHGSTDLSFQRVAGLAPGRINIIKIPRSAHDDGKRARFFSAFHAGLLEYYTGGFVVDCDEFLVTDPAKFADLREFATAQHAAGIRSATAIGVNVVHIPKAEPAFQPHIPILMQRRHGLFTLSMCKNAFACLKTSYTGGFHGSSNPPHFVDGFYLFHMKMFDHDWRLARQAFSRGWEWAGSYGQHARGDDEGVIRRFASFERMASPDRLAADFDFSHEIGISMDIAEKKGNIWLLDQKKFHAHPDLVMRMRRLPDWSRTLL